jgi:hypothetical protein
MPASPSYHGGYQTPGTGSGGGAMMTMDAPAMPQQQPQPHSPAGHAWVTTSRGGGTPAAFGAPGDGVPAAAGFSPMMVPGGQPQPQQQQMMMLMVQRSPLSAGGSPYSPSLPDGCAHTTPVASGSTARSVGTHAAHSIAGSCAGGSVTHLSRLANPSPPSSATSAASGRTAGSSRARDPAATNEFLISRLETALGPAMSAAAKVGVRCRARA